MSNDEHKAIVRRFFEAFEANDQATLKKVLAPDLVVYLPGNSDPVDREALLGTIGRWDAAFSNLHFDLQQQIAEGDMVANYATLRGVHNRGDFADLPPTGKSIAVSLITTERIKDGQIEERRVILDPMELMQQLGAGPVPGQSDGPKRS